MIKGFAYSAYTKTMKNLRNIAAEDDPKKRGELVDEICENVVAMYHILEYAERFIKAYDKFSEKRNEKAEEP